MKFLIKYVSYKFDKLEHKLIITWVTDWLNEWMGVWIN